MITLPRMPLSLQAAHAPKFLACLRPSPPAAVLLAVTLNVALRAQRPDALTAMCGRTVCIALTDLGMRLVIAGGTNGFFACRDSARVPDVTISAAMRTFLRLARHEADPDTLFFSRELLIEGDTELGLLLRNALDALDIQALLRAPPAPGAVFVAVRAAFSRDASR